MTDNLIIFKRDKLALLKDAIFSHNVEEITKRYYETFPEEKPSYLAASQPGEPGEARCPKCGSVDLKITTHGDVYLYIHCQKCPANFTSDYDLNDFAKFFGPSAPQPQPPGEVTKFRDVLQRLVDAAIVLCADYLSIWERGPDSKTVQGWDLGRWRLLLKVHTEARELLSAVAPSGSAGPERIHIDESREEYCMAYLNPGHHCGNAKPCPIHVSEPDPRAESAAEPHQCGTFPDYKPCSEHTAPVVRASPACNEVIRHLESCKKCAESAAPSVAVDQTYVHWPWCNGDRRFPAGEKGHCCCCFNKKAEEFVLADQTKVEEALESIDDYYSAVANREQSGDHTAAKERKDTVAAILRSFFPVSQTPVLSIGDVVYRILKMWEQAEQMPEMTGVRYDIAKEILINTWTVEEMLMTSLPGSSGPQVFDKGGSVTPVSGNGTEPPDGWKAEYERLQRTVKHMEETYLKEHGGSWGKCKYQAQLDALAGAASHNGQGWVRVEDGLPEYGTVSIVYCVGADGLPWQDMAGYSYHGGWSEIDIKDANKVITHWQPLPAPPSEADGPQVEFVHLPKSDWPEHIRKAFKEANGSEICNADPLNKQESHDE